MTSQKQKAKKAIEAKKAKGLNAKTLKEFDTELTKGEMMLDQRDKLRRIKVTDVHLETKIKAQKIKINTLAKKLDLPSAR